MNHILGAAHFDSTGVEYSRPRPSLPLAVARAAAWGGLTLIDPNKQSGWRKHAYWLTMAGVTAWEITAGSDDVLPETKAGVAVGLAGATYGAQDLLAKSDAWSMRLVEKVDKRNPRVWLALIAAATSLGMSLLDRKASGLVSSDVIDGGTPVELSDHVRGLLTSLFDGIDGYGSDELRAQMEHTLMVEDGDSLYFVPDGDAPLALIQDYVFPVRAEFERDDRTHIVELIVEDGRLGSLNHYTEPSWEIGEDEPDWSLPASDELTVVVGTTEA